MSERRRRYPLAKVKGGWTGEEDTLLKKLVSELGEGNWSMIARRLNAVLDKPSDTGRIGKQCRERYNHHLRPDIKKDAWTEHEEQLFVQAHLRFGNRWSDIAKVIPGRTENQAKNHWNATLRRKDSERGCSKGLHTHPSNVLREYMVRIHLLPALAAAAGHLSDNQAPSTSSAPSGPARCGRHATAAAAASGKRLRAAARDAPQPLPQHIAAAASPCSSVNTDMPCPGSQRRQEPAAAAAGALAAAAAAAAADAAPACKRPRIIVIPAMPDAAAARKRAAALATACCVPVAEEQEPQGSSAAAGCDSADESQLTEDPRAPHQRSGCSADEDTEGEEACLGAAQRRRQQQQEDFDVQAAQSLMALRCMHSG